MSRIQRVMAGLALALAGCGNDQAPAPDDPGGATDVDAGGLAAPDAPSGPATDAGLPPGDPLPNVNGCAAATAQDFTATALTVTFPSLAYTPKCARVRAGQTVTFNGAFADHPLRAGAVVNGVPTPASGSPIASTSTGTIASFTFTTPGAYPYYCQFHTGAGMFGAIYVVQ